MKDQGESCSVEGLVAKHTPRRKTIVNKGLLEECLPTIRQEIPDLIVEQINMTAYEKAVKSGVIPASVAKKVESKVLNSVAVEFKGTIGEDLPK